MYQNVAIFNFYNNLYTCVKLKRSQSQNIEISMLSRETREINGESQHKKIRFLRTKQP